MSEIIDVGEQQNGHVVELRLQQILRVTLPEVRTAGFRWSLQTSHQHVLSALTDDLDPAPGAAGGAAQHRWDFRAEVPGTTDLVFEYDRPWARAAKAARTFSVSVRVAGSSQDAAPPSP